MVINKAVAVSGIFFPEVQVAKSSFLEEKVFYKLLLLFV